VVYEAPYNDDPAAQRASAEYIHQLGEALADGRRGDAVALFMQYVGLPPEQITGMRKAPFWAAMEAMGQPWPTTIQPLWDQRPPYRRTNSRW
jgi:hypothetical protein